MLFTLTGTAVGVLAKIWWDGGPSPEERVNETEKKESSTRETATQTIIEFHSEPRIPQTEHLKKKNEQLHMKKKNEQLRQRILRLSKENNTLKLERDAFAAREAKANMERDEALQAKYDAFLLAANSARVADEAFRAEKEARRAAEQATLAKNRVYTTRDLWIQTRNEAIRIKDEAVRDTNEALRVTAEAVRAVAEITYARDRAIIKRDEAIRDREKAKLEAARAVERGLREHNRCATLVRENIAIIFARDQALLELDLLRQSRTREREFYEERLRRSEAAWLEKMREAGRLRRSLAAIAEQNSLRSITNNPPQ